MSLPFGAATVLGDRAVVLLASEPTRQLGPVLAWTSARAVASVDVFVDAPGDAAVVARRAGAFDLPVTVWSVDGRSLVVAEAAPPHAVAPPPEGVETLCELIRAAGAEVIVEQGVVTAELLGLEVARVVDGPDGPQLDVGVGRHDREAFGVFHAGMPAPEALAKVIDAVRPERSAPDGTHPMRRLAAERRLRATLVADPGSIGAQSLRPVEGTLARSGVDDRSVAVALGTAQGETVIVGCTVGPDLDAVPSLADARLTHDPSAELMLVLPARDRLPAVERVVALLRRPGIVRNAPADLA